MDIAKFEYEGHEITFDFGDCNKIVNATQLIKVFPDKKMINFLRNKQTKEYIAMLEERYANSRNGRKREVLRVVQGGSNPELQGTWMDEKLALKFAAWLSPSFELWVYDRIHELLTTGKTELKRKEESGVIRGLRMIVDQLAEQERTNEKFRVAIESNGTRIDNIEAKILSIDESYYSVSGYCSLHSIYCPQDKARAWGYEATKLSNKKAVPIGKVFDAKYGNINTYHIEILKQVIK